MLVELSILTLEYRCLFRPLDLVFLKCTVLYRLVWLDYSRPFTFALPCAVWWSALFSFFGSSLGPLHMSLMHPIRRTCISFKLSSRYSPLFVSDTQFNRDSWLRLSSVLLFSSPLPANCDGLFCNTLLYYLLLSTLTVSSRKIPF